MGRIKTTLVKRTSKKLVEDRGSWFSSDFNANKKAVDELLQLESKKIRNTVAGCITRLKTIKATKKRAPKPRLMEGKDGRDGRRSFRKERRER
jgi:small subunit ribosomal protein S17e